MAHCFPLTKKPSQPTAFVGECALPIDICPLHWRCRYIADRLGGIIHMPEFTDPSRHEGDGHRPGIECRIAPVAVGNVIDGG